MNTKKPANTQTTVVANDPDDRRGRLKNIGDPQSDHWNNILANQAVQALWLKNSSPEERDKQFSATIAALAGIAPKDELEGMMAAQLVAAHNAAMECYRRAMIGEQTLEGRRENLAQANKLSRTYAALLEALNRHGQGQQSQRRPRHSAGPRLRRDARYSLRVFLQRRRLRVPRSHRPERAGRNEPRARRLPVAGRSMGALSRLEGPRRRS